MSKKIFKEIYDLASKIAFDNKDLIEKTGFSSVGAVVVGESGKYYTGMTVGWYHSTCAEAVAFGNALQAGERAVKYVTAVKYNKRNGQLESVIPCGVCREMFSQLKQNMQVILLIDNKFVAKPLTELLPQS